MLVEQSQAKLSRAEARRNQHKSKGQVHQAGEEGNVVAIGGNLLLLRTADYSS